MINKVCVISLGTVGLPTAEYIYSHGFEVYGYDIRPKRSCKFRITTNWNDIPHDDIDIYVITVSTGWDYINNVPDLSALYDVCSNIARAKKALISIESTVPIGTCRSIANKYGFKLVVHVPHRYWSGDPINRGVKQLRVFGALNEESKKIGLDFYKRLEIPLFVVSNIEIAEMCKVLENAYRFTQIAFAEEAKMICDALGLNFEEVRKACNTKWNIDILEAREGIGGHCLPKDIRYMIYHAKQVSIDAHLLQAAVTADEIYKRCIKKKADAHV